MKKTLSILVLTIFISGHMNAQEKYTANPQKTAMEWLGEKVLGKHTGTIKLQSGWLDWNENKITGGEFLIDMTSIKDDDSNARLEGHLKSDDFFGVEKFPVSKLIITGSTPFNNGNGVVRANLTIKEITHPIEFKAIMQKNDEGTWFYSNIIVDRSKYNVRYGSGTFFQNLGDKAIYDEFKLKVSLLVQ